MQTQRFWVIGGEFRSMHFDQVVAGTEQLLGPFLDQDEAVALVVSLVFSGYSRHADT